MTQRQIDILYEKYSAVAQREEIARIYERHYNSLEKARVKNFRSIIATRKTATELEAKKKNPSPDLEDSVAD